MRFISLAAVLSFCLLAHSCQIVRKSVYEEYFAFQFDKANEALDSQVVLAEELGDRSLKDDAMLDFIEASRFENCTPQDGYIKSLRLN